MARASSSSFIKIPSLFGSKTSKTLKTADVREEKQATPVRKEYYVPRKFVPMTRKALIRRIVEDEKLVNPTDRHYFQGLAEVLDKSIAGSFHAALGELKVQCKNRAGSEVQVTIPQVKSTGHCSIDKLQTTHIHKKRTLMYITAYPHSPHDGESTTVMDSGFHVVDSGSSVSPTWVPNSNQ